MDVVNTRIGQGTAADAASTLNNRSFVSSNLVGYETGASQFTKSENLSANQQVKNAEKTLVNLPEQQQSDQDKKVKANKASADTVSREENVSFSESLSNISELLQTNGTKLSFTLSDNAEQPVVIVSDKESGNVIRQIPSEEVQRFAERIREIESGAQTTPGLVFDRQA